MKRKQGWISLTQLRTPSIAEMMRFGRFVHYYLRRYWGSYALLILIMVFGVFMSLFYASFLKNIMEAAVHHNMRSVMLILLLGLAMYALSSVSGFLDSYVNTVTMNRIKRDIKSDVFDKILVLPMRSINSYHSGDLLSRLQNDVDSVVGVIGNSFINLARMPLSAGAAFVYLLHLSPQLAWVSLSFGPLALFTAMTFRFYLRQNGKRIQEKFGSIYKFVNESLSGYSVIRSFSLEHSFSRRYRQVTEEFVELEVRGAVLSGSFGAATQLVGATGFLVSLGIGALYVAYGKLTVGALLAFVSLVHQLMNPFTGAANHLGGLQRALAAADRLWKITDEPAENSVGRASYSGQKATVHKAASHFAIRFEDVSFSYNGSDNALSNINIGFRTGSMVAIVGQSGAGKSTLFNLILGFYAPNEGRLYLNGTHYDELDGAAVRSQIAYVPQDTCIFSGTVRDNLLVGRPDATQQEIVQATRDANIHEFILSLPEGYETELGERGVRLSGGQKQRIAIARALLRDAPILLMDEATSALDSNTERAVQEALQRLMKGRTTIVVAHRLSTIQNADTIVVMSEGKIMESGNHRELMQSNSLYARLYGTPPDFRPFVSAMS